VPVKPLSSKRKMEGDMLAHFVVPDVAHDVAHIKLVDPVVSVGDGYDQVVGRIK
jgi:hypothetical protein